MPLMDFLRKKDPRVDPAFLQLCKKLGRVPSRRYFRHSRWLPHQGAREIARRLRQAEGRANG